MTDIARLQLDVDTRKLKQGERDLESFQRQSRQTAGEVDKASAGMAGSFKRIGAALAAAGIANIIYDFGKASVQAAIDAQEMESAFNVVFGNMADDVRAWAEETGNALGRSTQEIQRGALAFQELFGNALDPQQATEMSKRFAVLTQDLASFKNLSNEVAQQKLFSGLVGEAEPLRAVGVFLNEAAVQAKAAELGLAGVNGVLTDQEKIVARAAIIQEQLSAASGDVARTSGSTANQIKSYNAAVEELQVAIGEKLLPQLTPLITLAGEATTALAEAAQSMNVTTQSTANFVEGLKVLGGWVSRAADAALGFASAIGLTGERIQWLYSRAQLLINPLSTVVSLIERVGRSERVQQRATSLMNGSFSTDFIAGELAAFRGTTAAINAPSGLPAVSANLDRVGGSARSASSRVRAANDDLKETVDLAKEFRDLTISDASSGIMGNNSLFGFGATLTNNDFGLIGGFAGAFQEFDATLGKTADNAEAQTVRISETFAQMSQRITSTLQGLSNSIRSGDFIGILSGVLDIFTSLGSAGVFGSGVSNFLNRAPSFDGGGYTGSGARSGGLDGKGGFLAMLHPNETVIDHTRRQRPANDVNVTIGIDPRSGNILAFVDGRIAATAPAVANAGAMQAQAMSARSARRTVRR